MNFKVIVLQPAHPNINMGSYTQSIEVQNRVAASSTWLEISNSNKSLGMASIPPPLTYRSSLLIVQCGKYVTSDCA